MLNLSGDYKKITQIYLSSLKARDCRLEVQRLNSERPEEEEREGEARLEALRQAREAAALDAQPHTPAQAGKVRQQGHL